MNCVQMIRAKMLEVGTRTLGEVCDVERVEEEPALAAILGSRIASLVIEGGYFSAETLPLPPISRQFEMQLAVLWNHCQDQGADRQALLGAIERVVAELYRLTTADLVRLESSDLAVKE